MTTRNRNIVIKIEDLPDAGQKLSSEMAKAVMGGLDFNVLVPTAVGTLDYQRGVCRTDYNMDAQKTTSYGQVISSDGKITGPAW